MGNIDINIKEYKEQSWKAFMKDVKPSGVKVKGIPQDIVDAAIHVLGRSGTDWLQRPLNNLFDGKTAKEVLQMKNGEKALKAVIMRMH